MREVVLLRLAEARRMGSRDGTGTVGRLWLQARASAEADRVVILGSERWRHRAATFMREGALPRRAAPKPMVLPNGTGAIGPRSAWGWNSGMPSWVSMYPRWRCR